MDQDATIKESGGTTAIGPAEPSERPGVGPAPRANLDRTLLLGIGAGLVASAATGLVDRLLDPLISDEQRREEGKVRADSPHAIAGPLFAKKLLGRQVLSRAAERRARAAFGITYGVMWGLVYALVRRKAPRAARFAGLPFSVPFFLACDGVIAPLLGLTPSVEKIPWQLNAKELANHAAWTATAEMVHRVGERGEA